MAIIIIQFSGPITARAALGFIDQGMMQYIRQFGSMRPGIIDHSAADCAGHRNRPFQAAPANPLTIAGESDETDAAGRCHTISAVMPKLPGAVDDGQAADALVRHQDIGAAADDGRGDVMLPGLSQKGLGIGQIGVFGHIKIIGRAAQPRRRITG